MTPYSKYPLIFGYDVGRLRKKQVFTMENRSVFPNIPGEKSGYFEVTGSYFPIFNARIGSARKPMKPPLASMGLKNASNMGLGNLEFVKVALARKGIT